MIGEYGAVRREWSGHDFVNADAGPGEGSVNAVDQTITIGTIRAFKQRRLFPGTAKFAAANNFKGVVESTTELSFDIGAAGDKSASDCQDCEEGKGVSHNV